MPWSVKEIEDNKIIEVKYSGLVTGEDLENALAAAITKANSIHTLRFLADLTRMTSGHSIMDLLKIISQLPQNEMGSHFREALFIDAESRTNIDVRFYETACFNRGYKVKIFSNRDEAVEWLLR
jgi:hypothetical protein